MGYLASGFAFGSAPDWDGLRNALAGFALRGYKHKTSALPTSARRALRLARIAAEAAGLSST